MRGPNRWKALPAISLVAAWALFLAPGGCRPKIAPPRSLPAVLPSAEDLDRVLAASREQVHSLRSFAEISYRTAAEGKFFTGRHAVVAQRPDRFRLEAHSVFGLVGVATCDGETLSVYDRRARAIYRSAASAERIGYYLSVPMSPREVVSILLGQVPEGKHRGVGRVRFDDERWQFRLDWAADGVPAEAVWFGVEDLLVAKAEIEGAFGRRIVLLMEGYERHGDIAFPERIEVETDPPGGGLRLEYRDPALNQAVPARAFEIPSAPGVKEYWLDQAASETP